MPNFQNPSSPRFNFHKVFAALGIILFVVVLAGAGVWIYTQGGNSSDTTDDTVKVSTSSAKPATVSATASETADWKTLVNDKIGYSVKYPKTWIVSDFCDDTKATVFLAPTNDLLGKCSSGFGGLVGIYTTTESLDSQIALYKADDYLDMVKVDAKVGGKAATKISGTSKLKNEVVDNTGTREVHYLVDLSGKTLIINYTQAVTTPDYSDIFGKIIDNFKFL